MGFTQPFPACRVLWILCDTALQMDDRLRGVTRVEQGLAQPEAKQGAVATLFEKTLQCGDIQSMRTQAAVTRA